MAGFQLAGGAVDAVAALGLVERLHRRHVLGHGRRHLQAVLVEQVLAVHQDEDRDVERNPDQLVLVGRDAVHQGLGEVVPVEIRQRQVLLAVVVLARIDGVGGEQRRPGLVEVVEIIRAGLVLDVHGRLLQHLLQRDDLDLHLDAGIGRELVLGQLAWRRRWAASARTRSGSSCPCICSPPPGAISSSPAEAPLSASAASPDRSGERRPAAAKHRGREAGEADTGGGQTAQKLALADAPLPESPGTVCNIGLAVTVARAATVTH